MSDTGLVQLPVEFAWDSIIPHRIQQDLPCPTIYPVQTYVKRTDVSGTFTVDDTQLTFEKVPTGKGVFMWLLNRGCRSLYRLGCVPHGAVSHDGVNGLHLIAYDGQPHTPGVHNNLVWTETAVPYASAKIDGEYAQVHIAPDIGDVFSTGRVTNGLLSIVSDTKPIGENVAFTGTLCAATVLDVRSVFQTPNTNGRPGYSAFSSTVLAQASAESKDSIREAPVGIGVCTVVGPDIHPVMGVIDADFSSEKHGQYYAFEGTHFASGANIPPQPSKDIVLWNCWISPWRVDAQLQTGSGAGGSEGHAALGYQTIFTDPINPCGVLDFRLKFVVQPTGPSTICELVHFIEVVHVFASCLPSGQVDFKSFRERHCAGPTGHFKSGGIVTFDFPSCDTYQRGLACDAVPFVPGEINPMLPRSGLYIGTQIMIRLHTLQTGMYTGVYNGFDALVLYVTPSTLYRTGELGPVRILKYDDMGKTTSGDTSRQQLSIHGVIHVQGVPFGDIVPFMHHDNHNSNGELDVNVLLLLGRLFSSLTSPFRRVWRLDEFRRFTGGRVPSQDEIDEWLQIDGNIQQMRKARQYMPVYTEAHGSHTGNATNKFRRLDDFMDTRKRMSAQRTSSIHGPKSTGSFSDRWSSYR